MPIPGVDLPLRPPNAPAIPEPDEILKHPSLDARRRELETDIKDVPFVDIDPGVFDTELVKLKLYAKPNPEHLEKPPVLGGGNITKGTYAGTQAALTHAYSRIERSYESYFDVMQVESTLPRYTDLSTKRGLFQYSPYPKNADGTIARYPPHLQDIPKDNQVSLLKIFNALGLAETEILIKQVIPDSFLGKTATWLLDLANGNVSDAANQGYSIKAYETYNKLHRKSGTDIKQGANLGLLADWYGDRRFADQSFTGTNPTTIEKIPKDLLDEFIAEAGRGGYDDWAKTLGATDPSSLFVQDCRYFRKAVGAQPNEELHHKERSSDDSWACAAVTLFQLHPDGQLHPVAIVCDYRVNMASSVVIFNQRRLPSDPTDRQESDWPWRYAKTCAQVSDWIRHEVGVHLTRAHMIEESLIVATHRTIPMNHIVYKLLEPHWYKTLSLNAAARSTLVPQIIKDLVGLKPDYLYQFIRYEFENFDFVQSYIPNDLKRRGFPNTTQGLSDAKYKNYAYAKNMVSMWSCIREYVMTMLRTYYKDDKMVQQDQRLMDWSKEVQTNGFIKTFPTIGTLDQLCDAVTMSIHIAAPFHTAVNYLQNFYQAFVLAKPPCLCSKMPENVKDLNKYTEKNLVDALPIGRQRQWLLSVQIPWLLSFKVPSDRSLITFAQSQWRAHYGNDRADQEIRAISKRFYNELRKLEVEFLATSHAMDDGSIPYMVMDPTNTAVSILI
ncbi:putative linoleate 9S-lipoxygenase 3 [Metarhizium anisopliae]|nr:putative linoleate 9S-lipoxygenase 3 [Metarhizium anisopliae]